MDHFHDTHCGCSAEKKNRDNAIATARVRRDPEAAVHDISNGHPEPALFQSVVGLSSTEPRIWRAGAATLYIRYLLHGYERNYKPHPDPSIIPDPPWTVPLIGLVFILGGIDREKSLRRDIAIFHELQVSYSAVCAVIWRDLNSLSSPGPEPDYRRRIVACYIGNIMELSGYNSQLYDDTALALVMHCWMNMSADRENRGPVVKLVISFFAHGRLNPIAPSDFIDRAVRAVTIDTMHQRIAKVLSDPMLVDKAIIDELWAIGAFILAPRPWAQAFVRSRTYDHVAQVLRRHLNAGPNQFTPNVLCVGSKLLHGFQSLSREKMDILTDMIQNTPLFWVASQGLIIANQNQSDDWIESFDRMTQAANCHNPNFDFYATPAYLAACRVKLEPLYIPTRDRLRQSGNLDSQALTRWEAFAAAVGISESMLLEKWKRENQCCYPGCTLRDTKTAPGDLKKCAGCKLVNYHGKSCQRADWKRHKIHCNRIA